MCISYWSISILHYNDVIMNMIVSQITSLYSTVYSRRRSKKTSKLRVTGLFVWNSPVTGEFPTQRASNAENVSIWWRHHGTNYDTTIPTIYFMMMIPQIWKRHVYQLKYLCVVCLRSAYVPSYLKVRINFHKWILALTPFMNQNRHVFVKSVYVYIYIYIC